MNALLIIAAVYGTLSGGTMTPAPAVVSCEGYWRGSKHLTEAQANALGYALVADERPACASNETAVATGWNMDAGRIRRVYEVRTITPAPRRWTPLSIKRAAQALGKWGEIKSFLQEADAYDDFCMAQYEAEDDAQFAALMAAARARFGSETVSAILDAAEVEQ